MGTSESEKHKKLNQQAREDRNDSTNNNESSKESRFTQTFVEFQNKFQKSSNPNRSSEENPTLVHSTKTTSPSFTTTKLETAKTNPFEDLMRLTKGKNYSSSDDAVTDVTLVGQPNHTISRSTESTPDIQPIQTYSSNIPDCVEKSCNSKEDILPTKIKRERPNYTCEVKID